MTNSNYSALDSGDDSPHRRGIRLKLPNAVKRIAERYVGMHRGEDWIEPAYRPVHTPAQTTPLGSSPTPTPTTRPPPPPSAPPAFWPRIFMLGGGIVFALIFLNLFLSDDEPKVKPRATHSPPNHHSAPPAGAYVPPIRQPMPAATSPPAYSVAPAPYTEPTPVLKNVAPWETEPDKQNKHRTWGFQNHSVYSTDPRSSGQPKRKGQWP